MSWANIAGAGKGKPQSHQIQAQQMQPQQVTSQQVSAQQGQTQHKNVAEKNPALEKQGAPVQTQPAKQQDLQPAQKQAPPKQEVQAPAQQEQKGQAQQPKSWAQQAQPQQQKHDDKAVVQGVSKLSLGPQVDPAKVNPSKEELADLSRACDALWRLDSNRLQPDRDYELDLQHGKKPYQVGDAAPNPLFKRVDKSVFNRPTFKSFYVLLDNYERSTGVQEVVTREEIQENLVFIREIMKTAPMIYCHKYLVAHQLASADPERFKKELDDLWFGLYTRQTRNDSSGFEHVFVGEERDGKVMGMHNWIQLYMEESKKKLDYKGFILPRDRRHIDLHLDQCITIQFSWGNELKPVSTSLIGVSPEFEIALYTLCFLHGKEDNEVQLGPYRVNIKCFTYGHGKNRKLGSSFPEI